jgi:hypothetical protein
MQAITTKYINPTNTKGARIKATCDAGSITIPFDHANSEEQTHAKAAMALVRKLGWENYGGAADRGNGVWMCGSLPGQTGYCFVLAHVDAYKPTFA